MIYKFSILFFWLLSLKANCLGLSKDEIDFFNVGQGHMVLINKIKTPDHSSLYVPLLIDAGATIHPYVPGEKYVWEQGVETLSISKISKRIVKFWQASNNGLLRGGKFSLNIIITHPDKDHVGFAVLNELKERAGTSYFLFKASLLLGGHQTLYPAEFLKDYPIDQYSLFSRSYRFTDIISIRFFKLKWMHNSFILP